MSGVIPAKLAGITLDKSVKSAMLVIPGMFDPSIACAFAIISGLVILDIASFNTSLYSLLLRFAITSVLRPTSLRALVNPVIPPASCPSRFPTSWPGFPKLAMSPILNADPKFPISPAKLEIMSLGIKFVSPLVTIAFISGIALPKKLPKFPSIGNAPVRLLVAAPNFPVNAFAIGPAISMDMAEKASAPAILCIACRGLDPNNSPVCPASPSAKLMPPMLENPSPSAPVNAPDPRLVALPIADIKPPPPIPDVSCVSGLPPPLTIAVTDENGPAAPATAPTLLAIAPTPGTLPTVCATTPPTFANPPNPPARPPIALSPNPPPLIPATIHAIYFIHILRSNFRLLLHAHKYLCLQLLMLVCHWL